MAFLLKRGYEGYFWLENEVADPRVREYPLMDSPIPTIIIIYLWFKFIKKWGLDYMKNREPLDLKRIMIAYNIVQVLANGYIVYWVFLAKDVIDWRCAAVDYSESYWGRKFVGLSYMYFLLKIFDLIDTVFFVLRKKDSHITFLHTYHHFGMVLVSWIGTKFLGGGHSYFLGLANGTVHVFLYCYYLLTSYDSKFGRLLWLKKCITQLQLIQFAFLFVMFGQLFFRTNCDYPKLIAFFLVTQNIFMMMLFGDFYIKTYISNPRKKKLLAHQAGSKKGTDAVQYGMHIYNLSYVSAIARFYQLVIVARQNTPIPNRAQRKISMLYAFRALGHPKTGGFFDPKCKKTKPAIQIL